MIEFLKKYFSELDSKLNIEKVLAEIDFESRILFIEVLPSSSYLNTGFKEIEADIIIDFIEKFPDLNICFLNNDKLIKLKNPEIIFEKAIVALSCEEEIKKILEGEKTNISIYFPRVIKMYDKNEFVNKDDNFDSYITAA